MKIWNPNKVGLPKEILESELMSEIWEGLDPSQVWDDHSHLVGTGDSGGGVWSSPRMNSIQNPILWVQKKFYMNASGIKLDSKAVDQDFLDRTVHLINEFKSGKKVMFLAFDWTFQEDGTSNEGQTVFHIPNSYAKSVCERYPDYFEWIASIHPYRENAAEMVWKVKEQGARAVKWLPSSMGINLRHPKCKAFYEAMQQSGLPLLSHAGAEHAVPGGDPNDCNPLHLRHVTDKGVKVIVAHCASDGYDVDLDKGANASKIKSFDLFSRLMEEKKYEDLLFADISAMTLRKRAPELTTVIQNDHWHHRLLNGSDYPLPGVLPLYSINNLISAGLIEQKHKEFLTVLQEHNCLMFDFAIKRLATNQGKKLPNQIFETRKFFEKQK